MNNTKRILACILAATMLLGTLAACSKKNDDLSLNDNTEETEETTSSEESEYSQEDLIATGSFDETDPDGADKTDVNETDKSEENDAVTSVPNIYVNYENLAYDTYGGIPLYNITPFLNYLGTLNVETVSKYVGRADAELITSGDGDTPMLYHASHSEPDVIKAWLDQIFLEPQDFDTDSMSENEIELTRNMLLVISAGLSEFVPHYMTLDVFLGEDGRQYYDQWVAMISDSDNATNLDDEFINNWVEIEDDVESANAITPIDVNVTLSEVDMSNTEANGDVHLDFVVNCPELIGTNNTPRYVFLVFDDEGNAIDYNYDPYYGQHNSTTGDFIYSCSFNQKKLNMEIQGHVYAFRVPIEFYIGQWTDLTIDQCTFVY